MRIVTLIFSLVVISLFFSLALAQEADPLMPLSSPNPVSYILPYPGLLPDHPLYLFKKTRDMILELLIRSPVKKAEFMLLQADKKLNMSIFLMDKKNQRLAYKTLLESLNHLEKGEQSLISVIDTSDVAIDPLKDRYALSIKKHLEVMDSYTEHMNNEVQPLWSELRLRMQTMHDNFLSKK